jgi:hypothetical protein
MGNLRFTVLAAFIKHPQYCVSKSVLEENYQITLKSKYPIGN